MVKHISKSQRWQQFKYERSICHYNFVSFEICHYNSRNRISVITISLYFEEWQHASILDNLPFSSSQHTLIQQFHIMTYLKGWWNWPDLAYFKTSKIVKAYTFFIIKYLSICLFTPILIIHLIQNKFYNYCVF
jgi:hypothetical protein